MSSTSKKHNNFVSEPMGNKNVAALPGIGEAHGIKLAGKGFDKASTVLGKYLVQGKSEEKFTGWMNKECGANKKQQNDCLSALKGWTEQNL